MKQNCCQNYNKRTCTKVVITDLSNRYHYYQWFIYGMQKLSRNGEIALQYKLPMMQRIATIDNTSLLVRVINKIKYKLYGNIEIKTKAYLKGYIEKDGKRHTFCIDSADSPNMFNGELLRDVDCYFKIQCPKEFDKRGFKIGNVYIPFFDVHFLHEEDNGKRKGARKLCPEAYQFNNKIKPLFLAVRSMGRTCSFKELDATYKNLMNARHVRQDKKAMCYFGDARGPVPSENVTEPDYDWESDIMGYYGNKMHHPNEKRAIIGKILESLGDDYDARIINGGYSDSGRKESRKDLIIPLKDFSHHVARFQYNINVSGYRMSIPARFIDSFLCGTAIATDNLHVRWYHPFGKEVVEIGEMGYLPNEEVDYDSIKEKIMNLKPINKEYILEQYEKYYAPDPCARYIVDTVLNS